MARLWQQTEGEKRGMVAGLSLFFGALLGANLGTLGDLPLRDYVFLVILLVGAVATIQMSVTSERRGYAIGLILFYMLLLAAVYLVPSLRPALAEADLAKLLATLAIWLGSVVLVEVTPAVAGTERLTDE